MLKKLLICVIVYIQTADSSLPCRFIETINITSGYQDSHQNYIYKNQKFPVGTYKVFDYIEDYEFKRTNVNPHIRACACKNKACLRFCCLNATEDCIQPNIFSIINKENEEEIINLSDNNYDVLLGRSCEHMYVLDEEALEFWNFFEVSTKLKYVLP